VLLGRDTLRFSDIQEETDDALLSAFAARLYLGRGEQALHELPREVLFPDDFEDRETLEAVLSQAAGRKVAVAVPQRGDKRRLVELASTNARHALEDRVAGLAYAVDRADETLFDLQEKLDLKVVPRLMVCFDISHTQGSEVVASAVVFENGDPRKSDYRHMRIKGEWGNDDYASMHEAVTRYFKRRRDEEKPIPDLCLIDGGKGQLSAARQALESLGMSDVQLAALAKREEEVFLPGRSTSIRLDRRDRALHVLQRIRNEAHRFAVGYNRKLRSKRTIRSELGEIPGIGPNRQQALLTRFGSVRGIRAASVREIARVPGFSDALATRVLTYLGDRAT
jgi:excinuclease ABC subunit C